jgi:hypothetical protein
MPLVEPRVVASFAGDKAEMWLRFDERANGQTWLHWGRIDNRFAEPGNSLHYEVTMMGTFSIDSRAGNPDFPPVPCPDPATWPEPVTTTRTATVNGTTLAVVDVRGPSVCSIQYGTDAQPIVRRWDDRYSTKLG